MQVALNDLATLIAAVFPGVATTQRTPLVCGNQTQQTGKIINPASLPLEVQQRLEKGDQHDSYPTKQERSCRKKP